jgi:hypothetical protein
VPNGVAAGSKVATLSGARSLSISSLSCAAVALDRFANLTYAPPLPLARLFQKVAQSRSEISTIAARTTDKLMVAVNHMVRASDEGETRDSSSWPTAWKFDARVKPILRFRPRA